MSRYRRDTPIEYDPKLGCKVWGHWTDEDGHYCHRCGMPTDLWPTYTNGGIFQRLSHRFCWPTERWLGQRRPSQRWPFFRRCDDCQRVCEVWTWHVGNHQRCVDLPF
jgi:hypothetical protein